MSFSYSLLVTLYIFYYGWLLIDLYGSMVYAVDDAGSGRWLIP